MDILALIHMGRGHTMFRPFCLMALLLTAAPALAQNPQPTSPANPTVPIAPPNSAVTAPPEKIAPSDGSLTSRFVGAAGDDHAAERRPGDACQPPADQQRHNTGDSAARIARR